MNRSDEGWHGFWIGQQPTRCLYVTHLDGSGSEAWHRFRAEAAAPGFKAVFEFDAQLGEFEAFRDQVRAMYDALKGTVHFENVESNVTLDATIDHLGHVSWEIKLRTKTYDSPELSFRIEDDQTQLWNVAATIEDMLEHLSNV